MKIYIGRIDIEHKWILWQVKTCRCNWSIFSVGDGMTESLFWPVHDSMVLNPNNNKSINLTLQYYGQLPRHDKLTVQFSPGVTHPHDINITLECPPLPAPK